MKLVNIANSKILKVKEVEKMTGEIIKLNV